MAGTIRRPHISCPATACHGGADPYREIDCTISGTKVGSFCGVLSDWHTPKCDARDSRWFGIAKDVLRYYHPIKMMESITCAWGIVISPMIPQDFPPCYYSSMRNLAVLVIR